MITLILLVAVVGVVVYFIEQLPMSQPFKLAIRIIAVLGLVLYLVRLFGLDIPFPARR